jgi:hypothetical protein
MRDRHVLETVLIRRFPQATRDQVAAAANAIMALLDQWEADGGRELPRPDAGDAEEMRRRGRAMSGWGPGRCAGTGT